MRGTGFRHGSSCLARSMTEGPSRGGSPCAIHGSRDTGRGRYVEAMSGLSIGFAGVVAALDLPLDCRMVGSALLKALADHYEAAHSSSALYEFE